MHEYIPEAVREHVTATHCSQCCNSYAERDITGVGYESFPFRPSMLVVYVKCSLCYHRRPVPAGYGALDMNDVATGRNPDLFQTLNGPPPPKPVVASRHAEVDVETVLCDDGVPPGWSPDMPVLTTMQLRHNLRDTAYSTLGILGGYQQLSEVLDRTFPVGPPTLLFTADEQTGPIFDLILANRHVGRATRFFAYNRLRWRADWFRFGQVPAGAIFKIANDKCVKLPNADVIEIVSNYTVWQDARSPGLGQPGNAGVGRHVRGTAKGVRASTPSKSDP